MSDLFDYKAYKQKEESRRSQKSPCGNRTVKTAKANQWKRHGMPTTWVPEQQSAALEPQGSSYHPPQVQPLTDSWQ